MVLYITPAIGKRIRRAGEPQYQGRYRAREQDPRDRTKNLSPYRVEVPPVRMPDPWLHTEGCDCVNCDALLRGRMP